LNESSFPATVVEFGDLILDELYFFTDDSLKGKSDFAVISKRIMTAAVKIILNFGAFLYSINLYLPRKINTFEHNSFLLDIIII